MKLQILLGLLGLLISAESHAMSKSLRNFDDVIYSTAVEKPTQLRASDGAIVKVAYGDESRINRVMIQADKKKGNYLNLMVNAKVIPFKISGNPERVSGSKDFYKIQILSISSGQDHSIVFDLPHSYDYPPDVTNTRESCTIYRTETQCYYDKESHERVCREIEISTTGYREVQITSQVTSYTTKMSVRNNMGQTVITGELHDSETDRKRQEGPCYPGSY